ncbi:cobalamin-5'-phosphate synthase [Sulfobacillus thermosulfidooxidans DSM 9293]|uniref:Adenosylcobinamide-GDP ribazoletransferase n=1 Tax=Sulfobacillus thermosulfidooxidans (strain DSM 9293 / VKM B-1269 / AT-1) TaxID=929705 RepID=A0A1W1W6T9_SULTA|nr:adenosylcobinamide-GDP ribazoletransferase [Sulfobacillus thermosulfidooxidans]SMC01839.1 cobalamin-5'-phosphate synthase [Sulfobacillus thermosulfidooxidans DSM 9293]
MVIITGLFDALSILTRIPLSGESEWTTRTWALAWFPVVGALFGALWMIWFQLFPGLPISLRAVGALTTEIILTGGLHWDGWADVFDGWAARAEKRDQARKDSRIGTIGVLWVVLAVAAFIGLWVQVDVIQGARVIVFMAPVLARTAIAVGLAVIPASSQSQLAKWTQDHVNARGAVIAVMITLAVIAGFWGWKGILGLGIIAVGDTLFLEYWRRLFNGLNGDVLGATVIFTELLSLSVGIGLWR